jgi:MFS family permease
VTSPLANKTYRRLFIAQVIALAGTGLSTIALALLAYELAGGSAGMVLGTALALKMVAYVGIAPIVGGFADRLPRKRLLIALDISRAIFVFCLPFVDSVWQVYALIFLLNASSAGFTPTFQATIPDVLTDEARYTKALSLSRLAYDLENLLSPTVAALLLTIASFQTLFALNGLAFIASALLVLSVSLPTPARSERPAGVLHNITFGARVYLATPRLRGVLFLSFAVATSGAMVIVNTVVYVRDYLGGSETDTALAFAATGAGSMLVALLLPSILERIWERPVMLVGGALMAVALAVGIAEPDFVGLLALWFAIGLGASLVQTPTGRLLRTSCHPADRPALFSAQFALSHACWLLAYPLAGWLAVSLGMSSAFVVLTALAAVSVGAAWRVWPAARSGELDHTHERLDHAHLHVHDEHHQHQHEGWEGPEPHFHPHRHEGVRHCHPFVIDFHHPRWPT